MIWVEKLLCVLGGQRYREEKTNLFEQEYLGCLNCRPGWSLATHEHPGLGKGTDKKVNHQALFLGLSWEHHYKRLRYNRRAISKTTGQLKKMKQVGLVHTWYQTNLQHHHCPHQHHHHYHHHHYHHHHHHHHHITIIVIIVCIISQSASHWDDFFAWYISTAMLSWLDCTNYLNLQVGVSFDCCRK